MPASIHATELPLYKIFSDDYAFSIPTYQRPYSWTTEQASDLFSDIYSVSNGGQEVDELDPYFLGSIVLIKKDAPDADVVDGQQRLTTITILLSVMRKYVSNDFAKDIAIYLFEKGSIVLGNPNRYRIKLRSRDEIFFQKYIQEDGLESLFLLDATKLTDSQKNIQENAKYFYEKLKGEDVSRCQRMVQFLMKRCYLVVVSTPDIDAAYRIFTVMNARGLDLKLPDLLKAEVIGAIGEHQQEEYTRIWESEEEDLGRDAFQDLFAHIRMIYRRSKQKTTAFKEFREFVRPQDNPTVFIDEVLKPYSDAFEIIRHSSYLSDVDAKDINTLFRWLNQIDNFDWLPPAIVYLSRNSGSSKKLLKFYTDLERLAAGMMIQRADINERIDRYAKLLNAIDDGIDLYTPESPLQLSPSEEKQIIEILNGDLYLIKRIRQYILLRLDSYLSGGEATYEYKVLSVEHVLPQNPPSSSVWMVWFKTPEERANYVHKICNLVLLSRNKNSEAQNYDFIDKKEKYFLSSHGISPFAITTQVLAYKTWTPAILDQRQQEIINVLRKIWRLQS